MAGEIIKYEVNGNAVELSPQIVRQYLVNGQGNVTDQEIMMFLKLCEYQKLNPFLREVYLIKYGTEAATMVTGKETFLKRANRNPDYRGHKVGISADGATAWAEVYKKDYEIPIRCEVDYAEYVGRKRDGTITRMWMEKPRTMLKKIALVQALREAFPEDFGGLYSQEEINTIKVDLPTEPIQKPQPLDPSKAVQQEPAKAPAETFASEKQCKAIWAIGHAKGLDEDAVLLYISDGIGRQVISTKELTVSEASQVIEALNGLKDK